MSRSKWKGPYLDKKNLKKIKDNYTKTKISRNTEILPQFIEQTFNVYNGKKYTEILEISNQINRHGTFRSWSVGTAKEAFFARPTIKFRNVIMKQEDVVA